MVGTLFYSHFNEGNDEKPRDLMRFGDRQCSDPTGPVFFPQLPVGSSQDIFSTWIINMPKKTLKSSVFFQFQLDPVKTHKASRSSNPTFDWGDLSGCLPQLWTRCSSPETSACSRSKFGRGFCDTGLRTEPSILWRRYNLVGGCNMF